MLALLYDVHGNLPALDAVIADARGAGADRWLLGGDYVAWGGWPRECLERLQELEDAVWIRGNTDRWLIDDSELPRDSPQVAALEAARQAVGAEAVAWLGRLRERLTFAEGLFCHASPLNDMESFGTQEQEGEERLLAGIRAGRVVFGHTHVQFTRVRSGGIELVNPGSIGMPMDGDTRAAYGLAGGEGVQLRRVDYDVEAAAAGARDVAGDLFAQRILTAAL
jgi:predicted phosphodiesterase